MSESKYKLSLDPSFEALKNLPGGQGIYDYVRNKAEQLAVATDTAVMEIVERHELPLDPADLGKAGFALSVETHRDPDGKEHRAAVLYKKIDEVHIIV